MGKLFVRIAGQQDNLGDVVLHRSMIRSLRDLGQLNVLLESTEPAYANSIVESGDIIFTDIGAWHAALKSSLRDGPVFYFERPGELMLLRRKLYNDLKMAITLRRIAWGCGASFLLGVGARYPLTFWQKWGFRAAFAPYTMLGWREVRTAAQIGIGRVMPDWAFSGGTPVAQQPSGARDQLVVSLRVDRPEPSQEWFDALRQFAQRRELAITVVCQVARDMPRCRMLAEKLGGQIGPWIEGDFIATERALRELYGRTALAVSDRLHVLIISASEGAVPLCLLDRSEDKIGRHFDAIGFHGSAEHIEGPDVDLRVQRLEHHIARRAEIGAACDKARDDVCAIEARIAQLVLAGRS